MVDNVSSAVIVHKRRIVPLRHLSVIKIPPLVAAHEAHADRLVIVENILVIES